MRKTFYVSALIVLVFFAVASGLYAQNVSGKLAALERQNANFVLESKCAASAIRFYESDPSSKDISQKVTVTYTNHWNKKRRRCFVRVDTVSPNGNITTVDVFDALERKRYATFTGHVTCDPTIVNARNCTFDSGMIWMDGDDDRETGDYDFGYAGGKGRVGNANTKDEFLKHIHPLMYD